MGNDRNLIKRFYHLLNLFEDYCLTGFRQEHSKLIFPDEPVKEPPEDLESIAKEISICTRCNLCHNRLKAVSGEGQPRPLVFVIGEAPGADEDEAGRPFVGAAGQYLDKWLAAIGLSRSMNCFISNVVKCRPPQNRDPRPEELSACLPYLIRQLVCLKPRLLLALGRIAAQSLLGARSGISTLRQQTWFYQKIPLVVTYHPAAVLRDPSLRAPVWEDLKKLRALLEE